MKFDDLPKGLRELCLNDCKLTKEFCQQNANLINRIALWLYPELYPGFKEQEKESKRKAALPEIPEKKGKGEKEDAPSEAERRALSKKTVSVCSVDRLNHARMFFFFFPFFKKKTEGKKPEM